MPAAHVHTDPTIPAPDPVGPWLAVSAAFTAAAPTLTGREDLIVTCEPGAGRGSPGVFIPSLATIELDATHLPAEVTPHTIAPRLPSDRDRYPALWGVFVHEAAHATHSRWEAPAETRTTAAAQAADILEESRAEAAHLARRPGDVHWLRAACQQIILPSFTPDEPTPTPDPTDGTTPDDPAQPEFAMSPAVAARAAGLLLARVDAGVLDPHETTDLERVIEGVLGEDTLGLLRGIWQTAHTVDDDDATTMMILGELWAETVDDTPPPSEEPSGGPGEPTPLGAAIISTLGEVTASTLPAAPPPTTPGPSRASRSASRGAITRAAEDTFGSGQAPAGRDDEPGASGGAAIHGTRPPTTDERAAARRLARTLRDASQGTRTATTHTSPVPPGRLRMRGALAADAQRAAGALPTAEPFTRTRRRRNPNPPLHLGIACDISGSMGAFAGPVASTAWITAAAAAHIPATRTATVLFGDDVHPLTYPGAAPTQVSEFYAYDGTERFTTAINALTGALNLDTADATRMLIVISDGHFTHGNLHRGQQRLDALAAAGCHLLWIGPDHSLPLRGTRLIPLSDPADTATAIAQAITAAVTP